MVLGINKRIIAWKVEKCLGLDTPALQAEFWRIDQELDKKIRALDRKMISCRDGERMATLLNALFCIRQRRRK